VAIWQIWLLALGATLLVSAVTYRLIEVPCIAAGHYLARRLQPENRRSDRLPSAA
jgi:peptidoglycan/LPS O-acetylase OafA/YrhL